MSATVPQFKEGDRFQVMDSTFGRAFALANRRGTIRRCDGHDLYLVTIDGKMRPMELPGNILNHITAEDEARGQPTTPKSQRVNRKW